MTTATNRLAAGRAAEMSATKLTALLQRVAEIDTRPPRAEAIGAIRTIEEALVEALHGDALRGLPNLGTGMTQFLGVNLRAGAYNTRIPFPRDGEDMGTQTLVLRPDGKLAIAWTIRQPGSSPRIQDGGVLIFEFTWRGADDEDLRVEDLGAFLARLPQVLSDHLTKVEKTQATFAEIKDLAHRVVELVSTRRA